MYILKYSDYLVPVHNPVNKPTTQCTYHHIQCTLQPSAAYSQRSSAHCSTLQPSAAYSQASSAHTTAAIASSVHTAANCSHLQLPTLQLYHSVHTAAILSDANTIQCI